MLVDCPAGTYKAAAGASDCDPVPAGSVGLKDDNALATADIEAAREDVVTAVQEYTNEAGDDVVEKTYEDGSVEVAEKPKPKKK